MLAAVTASVTLARDYTDDVEWSAEDGSRTDPDFLARCVEAAIAAGATTINIPDTVGYSVPADITRIFMDLRARVPGADRVIFSTHCHNDLGLAVANTLAAVAAGARQIECTINGIGERAGNAALEEVAMAIRTRQDAHPYVNNIRTQNIMRTSKLLATITGFDVQPNKAIVGRNAFAHESGIHQDGVLKNAATYEIMTPESVGLQKNSLVLGKHSGRAAFRDKLRTLGYAGLGDNAPERRLPPLQGPRRPQEAGLRRRHRRPGGRRGDARPPAHQIHLAGTLGRQQGQIPHPAGAGNRRRRRRRGSHRRRPRWTPPSAPSRPSSPTPPNSACSPSAAVTEGTDAQARCTVRLEEDGKLV